MLRLRKPYPYWHGAKKLKMDLEKMSNILGAETVKKIYDDGLSQPVQETGKMLTDFIKAARLFTAPFQLLASYQDRLSKYFENIKNSVPVENQIEAPASLSGPIIDRLKYLDEQNYLTSLYINLLTRAIDKERINEAHPAFLHIIDQLSPDEVFLLHKIKYIINIDYQCILDYDGNQNILSNPRITDIEFDLQEFAFPEHIIMYLEHLESLNLINNTLISGDEVKNEYIKQIRITKTEFANLFLKACIPDSNIQA